MHIRALPFALLTAFACTTDVDDDASPRPIGTAESEDPDREIPVCDPDKELDRVGCRLGLTGAQPTKSCEAVLAGVNPDGSIWVTAKVYEPDACSCEWTPPGKVGNQTAACPDLDANYADPKFNNAVCQPVALRTDGSILTGEGTGSGATYDEAEAAALAACELAAQQRCTWLCAYYKDRGYHKQPQNTIDCCVPRTEACDGQDTCGESGDATTEDFATDDGATTDSEPVPLPTPD